MHQTTRGLRVVLANLGRLGLLAAVALVPLVTFVPHSQADQGASDEKPQFSLLRDFQGLTPSVPDVGDPIQVRGRIQLDAARRTGRLHVTATLKPGWHVYSVTQAAGGPQRTVIELRPPSGLKITGPFEPDVPPTVRKLDEFPVPVEEHIVRVTWSAPLEVGEEVAVEELSIEGYLKGQVCHDALGCMPLGREQTRFVARVAQAARAETARSADQPADTAASDTQPAANRQQGETSSPTLDADASDPSTANKLSPVGRLHLRIAAQLEPTVVAPGETIDLKIRAVPDSGWHVYAYSPAPVSSGTKPTLIGIRLPEGWSMGPVAASSEVVRGKPGDPPYHDGEVVWTVPLQVASSTTPGRYELDGNLGLQTCSDSFCDPPAGVEFATTVVVSPAGETRSADRAAAVEFRPATYLAAEKLVLGEESSADEIRSANAPSSELAAAAGSPFLAQIQVDREEKSLGYILVIAFLGGIVLNFMPCVLPVIGLKIMSFVQQAGEQRSRILMLNVWYTAGLLSIFLVLATLSAVANMGWGQQFAVEPFTVTMAAVVFAMGLSFLGVWEIPIPGFAAGSTAQALAQKEGPGGAFSKGVITTLLATPCTGPLMATALTWSAGKPAPLIYLVFTSIGLGMALPYLMIGAFPSLIRLLPRPGAWMETLKQVMGFILLGTVVFLLTAIDLENIIPTLALLFGIWAACWWVGRVPIAAERGQKLRAFATASIIVILIGSFAFAGPIFVGERTFWGLRGIMQSRIADRVAEEVRLAGEVAQQTPLATQETKATYELPWEPFSLQRLEGLLRDGKTVMVDFTANWCSNCKWLEQWVLNTRPVHEAVHAHQVVTLKADWSDNDPEVTWMLERLASKQIPVLAIFPGDDPTRPIVLNGFYKTKTLLEKLDQAAAGKGSGDRMMARTE